MGVAFVASDNKTAFADSATVVSNNVVVAAGNLVIIAVSKGATFTSDPTFTDGAGNTWSLATTVTRGTSASVSYGYSIISNANAADAITATWPASRNERKNILVGIFSKDATDTWSLDSAANGNGYGTAVLSGNLNTAGDDEVAFAVTVGDGAQTHSSMTIGDAAATGDFGEESVDMIHAWYNLLVATASNIHADATLSGAANWVVALATFKSTAASGVTAKNGIVPILMAQGILGR